MSRINFEIFGESHGKAIGVVMTGIPAGFKPDMDELYGFISRRSPGKALTTKRKEADMPIFLSGITNGITNGAPLAVMIENTDTRSGDYAGLLTVPRPSHADYPAYVKYGGNNDIRGGGNYSGRLTAPLVVAGGIVKQMLEEKEIYIGAHINSVGNVKDAGYDPVRLKKEDFDEVLKRRLPVIDEEIIEKMEEEVAAAAAEADSIGGVIECGILGLPVGFGETAFESLESVIAKNVFGVQAVKGIEFGAGFDSARMRGSKNNDPYEYVNGRVRTKTNNAGGILGGLATGMPVIFRAAFKPTPSIGIEQDSVDLIKKENTKLTIKGRHDPCIVLRAVPCIEAAAALAVSDAVFIGD